MDRKITLLLGWLVVSLPSTLLAATLKTLTDVVPLFSSIIQDAYRLLLSIAVFIIAWGIFKFILHADDEKERAEGRTYIIWGVIGVFLMLSVWGLVNILTNTVTLENTAPTIPAISVPTVI